MKKYRILQEGSTFYPQYYEMFQWKYFTEYVAPKLRIKIAKYSIESARDYIQSEIDAYAPKEIIIHEFNERPNPKVSK